MRTLNTNPSANLVKNEYGDGSMKNKRLTNVKRILDRNGIQYEVRGCIIITESRGEKTMRDIACKTQKYVSAHNIVYNLRKSEPPFVDECSLEIDTGTERDTILKLLEGVDYQESYGYFTTDAGEIHITDVLDVEPETSLYDLLTTEDRLVSEFNNRIFRIQEMNQVLRRMDTKSPRYESAMKERQGYIDDLELRQKSLIAIRAELREKI